MAITRTGNRHDKKKFWEQHIYGWEESGLSQKAYCESHTLPLQSFGYWKRKLKQTPTDQPCFYPLTIPKITPPVAERGGSSLCLLLSKERFRIEINEDFSVGVLKKLIVALEQL